MMKLIAVLCLVHMSFAQSSDAASDSGLGLCRVHESGYCGGCDVGQFQGCPSVEACREFCNEQYDPNTGHFGFFTYLPNAGNGWCQCKANMFELECLCKDGEHNHQPNGHLGDQDADAFTYCTNENHSEHCTHCETTTLMPETTSMPTFVPTQLPSTSVPTFEPTSVPSSSMPTFVPTSVPTLQQGAGLGQCRIHESGYCGGCDVGQFQGCPSVQACREFCNEQYDPITGHFGFFTYLPNAGNGWCQCKANMFELECLCKDGEHNHQPNGHLGDQDADAFTYCTNQFSAEHCTHHCSACDWELHEGSFLAGWTSHGPECFENADDAKAVCETVSDCGGINQQELQCGGTGWTLRNAVTPSLIDGINANSWLKKNCDSTTLMPSTSIPTTSIPTFTPTSLPSIAPTLSTTGEPTLLPTFTPTGSPSVSFRCNLKDSDDCWEQAQISRTDCVDIKQWYKERGQFLDITGKRNFILTNYGVDAFDVSLNDAKNSFIDHCGRLPAVNRRNLQATSCTWKEYSQSGMLACPEPRDFVSTNLEDCKSQALNFDANAIQFLDGICRFKTCDQPGNDADLVGSGVELRWKSYYCEAEPLPLPEPQCFTTYAIANVDEIDGAWAAILELEFYDNESCDGEKIALDNGALFEVGYEQASGAFDGGLAMSRTWLTDAHADAKGAYLGWTWDESKVVKCFKMQMFSNDYPEGLRYKLVASNDAGSTWTDIEVFEKTSEGDINFNDPVSPTALVNLNQVDYTFPSTCAIACDWELHEGSFLAGWTSHGPECFENADVAKAVCETVSDCGGINQQELQCGATGWTLRNAVTPSFIDGVFANCWVKKNCGDEMETFCGDGICQDGEMESFCMVDCTNELADSLCKCVTELDLLDETCSALTDFQTGASDECLLVYGLSLCGSLIQQDTLYRDFCGTSSNLDTPAKMPTMPTVAPFCGDGVCQDGEMENFCMVDCTEELADSLCQCVTERDLCDETCSAITDSEVGESDECQLIYALAFCGSLIQQNTLYRDFCGPAICSGTPKPTTMRPTNLPTPTPFYCDLKDNDNCWSAAEITTPDCIQTKQWYKERGQFLDIWGVRNYILETFGVNIINVPFEAAKTSFVSHCKSL